MARTTGMYFGPFDEAFFTHPITERTRSKCASIAAIVIITDSLIIVLSRPIFTTKYAFFYCSLHSTFVASSLTTNLQMTFLCKCPWHAGVWL